ncbi:MAG: hypothetical protein KVP17_003968 [Porospora cf. gigantea B]|uniref:uncharacterized protein n=1 Tax=Porospora cf. gigantea B TaxID=2853592 RepID=UPI003571A0D1|nr:MAG: hypothetical protein KVP17_003968 [Porospora cf. gigantea B]
MLDRLSPLALSLVLDFASFDPCFKQVGPPFQSGFYPSQVTPHHSCVYATVPRINRALRRLMDRVPISRSVTGSVFQLMNPAQRCRVKNLCLSSASKVTPLSNAAVDLTRPSGIPDASNVEKVWLVCDEDTDIPIFCPNQASSLRIGSRVSRPVMLPACLRELEVGPAYTHNFDAFPPSLRVVKFLSDSVSKPQSLRLPLTLAPRLEVLHLPSFWNEVLEPGWLPTSLRELRLGYMYNQSFLPESLPPALRKLAAGHCFSSALDHLPASLETLKLGSMFNQPVGILPSSLKRLIFGSAFSYSLSNLDLPHLEDLVLGYQWRHPVSSEWLPSSLRSLTLKALDYFSEDNVCLENTNIEHLVIRHLIADRLLASTLPRGLISLVIQKAKGPVDNLPETLQDFSLGQNEGTFPCLPAGLKLLKLSCYDGPLHLPPALERLCLGVTFNSPLPPLPMGLRELFFVTSFNQPISPGVLPPSLRVLALSSRYNRKLSGILPQGLRKLVLGPAYDAVFVDGDLPSSLRTLEVQGNKLDIRRCVLPKHLSRLVCGSYAVAEQQAIKEATGHRSAAAFEVLPPFLCLS